MSPMNVSDSRRPQPASCPSGSRILLAVMTFAAVGAEACSWDMEYLKAGGAIVDGGDTVDGGGDAIADAAIGSDSAATAETGGGDALLVDAENGGDGAATAETG